MTLDASESANSWSEFDVALNEHSNGLEPRDRLVVALDTATVEAAGRLVTDLGDAVRVYKIGLELIMSRGGMKFARELKAQEKKVFLDMKILDIPNTVEKAVANAARMEFDFLTVHGIDRKTLSAAVEGRERDQRPADQRLKLLSVTVLTSLDEADLQDQCILGRELKELAVHRARMAYEAGFDGVIASGHEIEGIRAATSRDFIIKVPGIRLASTQKGDQVRVMTPTEARRRGATYLVIGRPITQAENPARMVELIVHEIRSA